MPVQRVMFSIYGKVQGVNFRNYLADQASRTAVTGWCRNSADSNKIEGEAQGETSSSATATANSEEDSNVGAASASDKTTADGGLDAFLEALKCGPPQARVQKVIMQVSKFVTEGEKGFEIRT